MPAADNTRPANEIPDNDLLQRQKALTFELYNHSDPHVRLLAHMSERQLGLMELLIDTRKSVTTMATSMEDLATSVRELTGRQDTVEQRLNNGDGGHQLDLPHTATDS